MLYSPSEKVAQYLTQYNIENVFFSKGSWNTVFYIRNLKTGLPYKIEIENPLYNVLSDVDSTIIEINDHVITQQLDSLRRITFSDDSIKNWYTINYYNSPYRIRYKTLEIEKDNKLSSEYFTYMELKDISKILQLTGIETNSVEVYGNFIKIDDNSLRFLFNPKYPVLDQVDKVLMCDFYLLSKAYTYPIYYIIYTLPGSNDVYLEYSNLLVNSITNKGSISVNLTQLFSGKLDTIYNDLLNLDGYNNKWFIVNNIFNIGIFYNSPNGIIRYIPINLDINFFKYIFSNVGVNTDLLGKMYPTYKNLGEDNQPKTLTNIIKEKRIVPLTDIEGANILNQLVHLSSYAEYFNDVLFNLNSSTYNFPVHLITNQSNMLVGSNYPEWD